jgi:hypothetical protein
VAELGKAQNEQEPGGRSKPELAPGLRGYRPLLATIAIVLVIAGWGTYRIRRGSLSG